MAYIRSLLVSPPTGTINSQTVYGESELQAVNNKTLTPVRPCVFLLATYMRPEPAVLPMIVVDMTKIKKRPFELGNRNGRMTQIFINTFGRQRGETDDLASFFQDNFGPTFPVYDYTSGSGTFVENAEVEYEIDCDEHLPSSDAVRQEGSLDLWMEVDIRFWTKN
jgi:hypothetical protein